ncbi:oral cancer overexpressed protein [Striga asiatica]|uniref:Oral cancer overexpressed protein n=1 Tax=Striga asiatica TaxID=4170 RepID=A0A5A7PLC5_STRAF|nr:oral cancer overexpressed protein [Striga asiatica]
MAALQRYLPSNRDDDGDTAAGDAADEFDVPADAFSFTVTHFKEGYEIQTDDEGHAKGLIAEKEEGRRVALKPSLRWAKNCAYTKPTRTSCQSEFGRKLSGWRRCANLNVKLSNNGFWGRKIEFLW